jgi:hypothetical protein
MAGKRARHRDQPRRDAGVYQMETRPVMEESAPVVPPERVLCEIVDGALARGGQLLRAGARVELPRSEAEQLMKRVTGLLRIV